MRKAGCSLIALVVLALVTILMADSSTLAPRKRSKSDKDIKAIGRRKIGPVFGAAALKREQLLGEQMSAQADHSSVFVSDPEVSAYVTRVAENTALKSDADMAIKVRVLDRDDADFCALPAGYLYVTRGMLLNLDNEGELASLLARGIAHTALHTYMVESRRAELLKASGLLVSVVPICTAPSTVLSLIAIRESAEFDADFFGIQYVYVAGYDPEDFVRFVQRVWGPAVGTNRPEYWPTGFPPLSQRVKALREEIREVLPARDAAVLSTSEFEEFQKHLRAWNSAPIKKPPVPSLIRQDSDPR
jgi:beta-barrel assembly-enhancing protease